MSTITDFIIQRTTEDEARARSLSDRDAARRLRADATTKRELALMMRGLTELPAPGDFWRGASHAATGVLKVLAASYDDHPDFVAEWRP